jgi:hypothetical protein
MNNQDQFAFLDNGISDNFKNLTFDEKGNPLDKRIDVQKKRENTLFPFLDAGISDNFKNLLGTLVNESDMYESILLLTILNSQSKKTKINTHGYDAAIAVECLSLMLKIKNEKSRIEKDYGISSEIVVYNLYSALMKSTLISLEAFKRVIDDADKYQKAHSHCLLLITNEMPELVMSKPKKTPTTHDNIYRFYLSAKSTDLQKKYLSLKLYEPNELQNIYRTSYCKVFEISIKFAWLLSGSSEKDLTEIGKIGLMWGLISKIHHDFCNIDNDLENVTENSMTDNYLINVGLQRSFDDYMHVKENLITLLMTHDIYSRTIKEIIEDMDSKIDTLIENSNPDILSSYSTH